MITDAWPYWCGSRRHTTVARMATSTGNTMPEVVRRKGLRVVGMRDTSTHTVGAAAQSSTRRVAGSEWLGALRHPCHARHRVMIALRVSVLSRPRVSPVAAPMGSLECSDSS